MDETIVKKLDLITAVIIRNKAQEHFETVLKYLVVRFKEETYK